MGVVVRKSSVEVVRPPEPVTTSTEHINLSLFDKNVAFMPATLFFMFDRPIHKPAETIKRALSKALAHYLPVAGRLAAGPGQDEELRISCTGEGVSFVAAAASCALKDAKFYDQSALTSTKLVDELAMSYPAESCGLGDPLLLMQVTEFACGRFVVGVTINHVIADGGGLGQFLQAIGELARGLSSPSVVPVRWDDGLTGVNPCTQTGILEFMSSLPPVDMAVLDITVPSWTVNIIKEEYRRVRCSNGGSPPPCTTFEAVIALLWQCRTRAIRSNPEDPVALYFTVNARKHVGARHGYYGNCATGQLVMAMGDAVANGDLVDVVEMIKRGKSQVAEQFNKSQLGAADVVQQQHGNQLVGYNLFGVTSLRNLGLEEVDFGGGPPAGVTTCAPQRVSVPGCVPCVRRGIHGAVNVLAACVTKEHAAAFLGELSSRINRDASTIPLKSGL